MWIMQKGKGNKAPPRLWIARPEDQVACIDPFLNFLYPGILTIYGFVKPHAYYYYSSCVKVFECEYIPVTE